MIYFILFCIWYFICAIGVGKAVVNGYAHTCDIAIWGGVFWPFTILLWAFWG